MSKKYLQLCNEKWQWFKTMFRFISTKKRFILNFWFAIMSFNFPISQILTISLLTLLTNTYFFESSKKKGVPPPLRHEISKMDLIFVIRNQNYPFNQNFSQIYEGLEQLLCDFFFRMTLLKTKISEKEPRCQVCSSQVIKKSKV